MEQLSKVCSICHQEKLIQEFSVYAGVRHSRCRICKKKDSRSHYQQNKAAYIAKTQAAIARTRGLLESLKNKPCADCHEKYPPYVMDFDHREGEEKEFVLSKARCLSVERILAEAAKCDVVCANCHRMRTHVRRERALKAS